MPIDRSIPSEATLADVLSGARSIAVVGASSKPHRPSHDVMRALLDAGFRVIPVNPNESSVLGQRAYPSLRDVPEPVDIVDVFRRSEETPPIADDAVAIGAKVLWMQVGVINDRAAARARAGGLMVVMDRCLKVTVARFGIRATPSDAPADRG